MDWRQSAQQPLTYKFGNSTIRFQKPLVAALAVILFALFVLFYVAASGNKKSGYMTDLHEDHLHLGELIKING